ncbi:MAG: hypothetical protein Kow00117_09860 [Phototrophicales bacterium]
MKVYHIVPPNLQGTQIYPLNALKNTLPEIYAQQVQKYRGRAELLQRKIPYLNCTWNDMLHFSPVNPRKLRAAFIQAGFKWNPMYWYEIDPEQVGLNEQNTVIYLSPIREKDDFTVNDEDFIPFTLEALVMLDSIPKATTDYFNHAKAHNENPFLFNFIPHVLYYGTLDITHAGVSVLEV